MLDDVCSKSFIKQVLKHLLAEGFIMHISFCSKVLLRIDYFIYL
jgi:hypothetical protein